MSQQVRGNRRIKTCSMWCSPKKPFYFQFLYLNSHMYCREMFSECKIKENPGEYIMNCQKQLLRDRAVGEMLCRHEVAVGQWWSDVAEYISEGVHCGSHLARHHCSGEQLVQLNQFVGCCVKLERNAVQRVPRFHLDHRNKREDTKSHSCRAFP